MWRLVLFFCLLTAKSVYGQEHSVAELADRHEAASIFARESYVLQSQNEERRSAEELSNFFERWPGESLQAAARYFDQYARVMDPVSTSNVLRTTRGIEVFSYVQNNWILPRLDGDLGRAGVTDPIQLRSVDGNNVNLNGLSAAEAAQVLGRFLNQPELNSNSIRYQTNVPGRIRLVTIETSGGVPQSVELVTSHNGSYIRILDFISGETARQLSFAVSSIALSGQALIIDLRFSEGGDLFEAYDAADLFLQDGITMGFIRQGEGLEPARVSSETPEVIYDGPIFVLAGPMTASAAEAFLGAIRVGGLVTILGEETFGKCLVQSGFPLPSGRILSITTFEILDATQSECVGETLSPDVRLENITLQTADQWQPRVQQIIAEDRSIQRDGEFLVCVAARGNEANDSARLIAELELSLGIAAEHIRSAQLEGLTGQDYLCLEQARPYQNALSSSERLSISFDEAFSPVPLAQIVTPAP